MRYRPIEGLWTDCLEFIALFPPCAPTGVLKTTPISNLVLLTSHAPPRAPYVLFLPVVRKIVDLAIGEGGDFAVVYRIDVDRTKEYR